MYPTGDAELEALVHDVYDRFLFANALNPLRFPALARIEKEVIAMAGDLVHRAPTELHGGTMTSGGTESILMSMLVSRERARARGIKRPQILAPLSAYPAYAKAAHYFDMDYVGVSLDGGYRVDVAAAQGLVTENTCVIVASAYTYPHGVMDPVVELAALAAENGIGCHVDACIGGFVLPFMETLGHPVPPWDFRVEGVTEISMDVHKYGYVPKGGLGHPAPRRRLDLAPDLLLRQMGRGSLRDAGHCRRPLRRTDGRRVGGDAAPRPRRLQGARRGSVRHGRAGAHRNRGNRRSSDRR